MPRLFGSRDSSTTSGERPVRRWWTPAIRRYVVLGTAVVAGLGVAVVLALWLTVCMGGACPAVEGLENYDPDQAAKVYAADGRLITDLGLERRTVLPLSEISPAVSASPNAE